MTEDHEKKEPTGVSSGHTSEQQYQTLTLVAVSSFGESLRWVPHHPSGGSHLSLNLDLN
jgi:hypothetical protein